MIRKTKRVMKAREKLMRDQSLARRKFLRKCERLGIAIFSYDEATRTMMCGYSPDEYQIGLSKNNTSSDIGNLYISEEDYDAYYLED